ncbi:MAG TPA: hypothetical protein VII65_00535 [Acidimicrobiales bacterium]
MTRDKNVGRRRGLSALFVVGLLVTLSASPLSAAGPATVHNPKANITPRPNYLESAVCTSTGNTWRCANPCASSLTARFLAFNNGPDCTQYLVQIVNDARKLEHLQPMVLPTNWYSLTPIEQLFVLADLERTARGLPPYLGINATLNASAQKAALSQSDPSTSTAFPIGLDAQHIPGMGSLWGTGFSTIESDYEWMYNDGWGGTASATFNISCTSPSAPACWGHRDELLGYDGTYNPGVGLTCKRCEMGVGFAVVNGHSSFTDLIELSASTPPPMTFTWVKNVVPYLSP